MNASAPQGVEANTYVDFLKSLELVDIALVRSGGKIDRAAYLNEEDTHNSVRGNTSYEVTGSSNFRVSSTIVLRVTSPNTGKVLLRVLAGFELDFQCTAPDEEFLKRFMATELKLMIWPYFREYVDNVTARMHVPAIILPLVRRGAQDRPK